jgi:hypothetical protein
MFEDNTDYILDTINDVRRRARKVNKGFKLFKDKVEVGYNKNDFMLNQKTATISFTAYKAPRIAFR